MELKVKKVRMDAKLPQYGHTGDAGLDLFSSIDFVLEKGQVEAIPSGVKVAIPDGYVGLIWDKSGVSLKGVHRLAGVIDSGYRGEVKVVMINFIFTSCAERFHCTNAHNANSSLRIMPCKQSQ